MTAEAFPQHCIDATMQAFGGVDILINNAGACRGMPRIMCLLRYIGAWLVGLRGPCLGVGCGMLHGAKFVGQVSPGTA